MAILGSRPGFGRYGSRARATRRAAVANQEELSLSACGLTSRINVSQARPSVLQALEPTWLTAGAAVEQQDAADEAGASHGASLLILVLDGPFGG